MTDVASAPGELRDRWRHDLNNAATLTDSTGQERGQA